MTAQATPRPDITADTGQQQRAQRRASRRPPPRRRSLVRAIATYLGIAILFVVVAVATFLLIAPPIDIVRERLIAEFQARTGYLLEINGQTTLRLVPGPSVEFRDVVVATPGEGGAPVLRIESIEVEPQMSALLRGRVLAERVMVRRPQLDLVIDAEGRRKWQKPSRQRAELWPIRVAQLKDRRLKDDEAAGRFAPPMLRDVGDTRSLEEPPVRPGGANPIPSIRISDGIVRYRDLRTGSLVQSDQVQVRIAERGGQDARLMMAGTMAFGGETVKFQLQAALPEENRSRRADRIALKLDGRHGTVAYDGSIGLADRTVAHGAFDISTKDARDAMRWLGFRSRDATLMGPLSFKGRIDARGNRTAIEQMSLSVDGAKAAGGIVIDHDEAGLRFGADLNFAELDIDRLRAKADQKAGERAQRRQPKDRPRDVRRVETATAPSAASTADADENDSATGTLLPRQRAWRTEPIPFVTLSTANGEARIRASRLVWRGATMTDAAGGLTLADGAMKIDIREGAMHGGRVRGVISASASGHVGVDLALDDVSALETLSNSGRFEMLEGPARIRVAVAGHGATEKEIVDTLTGTATIDITKGAIRGWSIDDILATARRLQLPNLKRDADARTRFERLSAAVVIKDGVAAGKDMRITASPIGLDSTGTIDLRSRTLELTLSPRISSDAATGAGSRFAGLSVPLQLSGPWERPGLSADYQSVLKSPQKAIDAAREAARGIKDEDIDKAAKRFLGDTPEAEKGAKRAKELLKRFLDR